MPKWKLLNGNALKLIAIVTMLIDHIGAAILETGILGQTVLSQEAQGTYYALDMMLRMIGRISFPIFCFLLLEGFYHTKDVKKYALRLLAFAFISEIPFDLAFYDSWVYMGHQNIYFTLFLGLVAMAALERCGTNLWKKAAVVAAACVAAVCLRTDYDVIGVCLILVFYALRYQPVMQTVFGSLYLAGIGPWPAIFAFIPIRLYNGQRGKWNLKYIFYAFYPVHLAVLWVVRLVILRG